MSDQKKKRQNSSFRSSRSCGSNSSINGDGAGGNGSSGGGGASLKSAKSFSDPADSQRNKLNQASQAKNSADHFRKIVQREGRTARNLVTWNVPLDTSDQRKPMSRVSVQGSTMCKIPQADSSRQHQSPSDSRCVSSPRTPSQQRRGTDRADAASLKIPGHRQCDMATKKDLRARYWAFLFENLHRAVDEIYQTCETDESVVECKEVIMMLDQCTKDFKSLIERLQLMRAYENADERSRPTYLAWEVRKSSPGKSLSSSHGTDGILPSPTVVRSLTFSGPVAERTTTGGTCGGNSWADRVRGTTVTNQSDVLPTPVPATHSLTITNEAMKSTSASNAGKSSTFNSDDEKQDACEIKPSLTGMIEENKEDSDGWETVHRAGKLRTRPLSACISIGDINHVAPQFKRSLSALAVQNDLDPSLPLGSQSAHSMSALNIVTSFSMEGNIPEQKTSPVDSEKENCPYITSDLSVIPILQIAPKPDMTLQTTIIGSDFPDQMTNSERIKMTSVNAPSGPLSGLVTIRETVQLEASNNGTKSDDQTLTPRICKRGIGSSDEDADGEYEDEEEENVADLDKALRNVLDEEDSLEHELEQEREKALKSAMQEEASYLNEIALEESLEIVIETEPDTEAENEQMGSSQADSATDWETLMKQHEEDMESVKGLSWGDRVEDGEGRTPGRVVHVHEKLSSPSRKKSSVESKRQHEEKQAKAQELREKLQQERAERLRMLTKKVEEVQAYKNELLQQRRNAMERRLKQADEKRQIQLQMKIRKAHEEETKANEIAFINTLEAQNKRHDIMSKHQESEARLQDLQEERQRKHGEKAAYFAAVEERRRAIEAEKQSRLLESRERRRQRESVFERRQQEKEKGRLEAARAKERDREERLAALNKQQQAHIEELQKKIQQKQDDTDRRHKEKLEAIQEKAFRMSILHHSSEENNEVPPKLVPYEKKKFCLVCNVMIPSEVYLLSHLRGKKHQQALSDSSGGNTLSKQEIENFNLMHISDAPSDKADLKLASDKERHKVLKKRCKKLRFRMTLRGVDYEKSLLGRQPNVESENRNKIQKIIKDLQKCLQTQPVGPWPQNRISSLERNLGEIGRIFEKKLNQDLVAFSICGGLTVLCDLLKVICQVSSDLPPVVPIRTVVHACTILTQACSGCYDNCQYLLLTNKICILIEILNDQLNLLVPDNYTSLLTGSTSASQFKLPYNPLTSNLTNCVAAVLDTVAKTLSHHSSVATDTSFVSSDKKNHSSNDTMLSQSNDIVSYIIGIGIVDKLALYLSNVRGPVDNDAPAAEFLCHSLLLLTALIGLTSQRTNGTFEKKKLDDPTQLIVTLKVTQLVGIVSLMYGMLLHADAPARSDNPPPPLPQHALTIATMSFKMLNRIAELDLQLLQGALGEEGTSLEFRHISSYLLWYCNHCVNEELLHEIILCIGFFSVLNHDNQMIIQSGQSPTILQQLCALPFQYFSDARLTTVLFPTLVSCCFMVPRNREILEQELSCALLANFIEEKLLDMQHPLSSSSNTKKTKTASKEVDGRMLLASRFPVESWSKAVTYFSTVE